jgi:hypothetical protein
MDSTGAGQGFSIRGKSYGLDPKLMPVKHHNLRKLFVVPD